MPTTPIVVRRKKTPEVIVEKTEKILNINPKKSIPVKSEPQDKPENPKGPAPVDKVSQHLDYLKDIESLPSPDKEIAGA